MTFWAFFNLAICVLNIVLWKGTDSNTALFCAGFNGGVAFIALAVAFSEVSA